MGIARTQHVVIREMTGQLPKFPDRVYSKKYRELHPYAKGKWFYIEIHIDSFGWFGPVAMGVVHQHDGLAEMSSMWVMDGVRRKGYGRQLIEIAGDRWPALTWTDCDESRSFHKKLVKEGIAKKEDRDSYYDFVPVDERQRNSKTSASTVATNINHKS